MLIKSADDKTKDISSLESILTRSDLTNVTKKRIEQEIKNIHAGMKGEREAAYEINFHFEASPYWALIHDLRIECNGRVAQIDHLIINRKMDIWVCESKHFSESIAINENGECNAFYNNKPYGVASPFEQNKKHTLVLDSIFKSGLVKLPTRLGFNLNPSISSLILVSKNARISRPKIKTPDSETIIKNDQLKAKIDELIDADNNFFQAAKFIASDTLENFARKVAELHIPMAFDWYAKFGLTRVASTHLSVNQTITDYKTEIKSSQSIGNDPPKIDKPIVEATKSEKPTIQKLADVANEKKKLICSKCGEAVSYTVAKFCWFNKPKFSGNVFCMDCQKIL